jgi:activating signal cointegrator complex subunit 1
MPPKPFPTHFLCIPLVNGASRQQLISSLTSFAADITSPNSYGVPAGAVRPVGTLHLTLGVMHLSQRETLEKAVEVLNTLDPRKMLASINPPGPTSVGKPKESKEPARLPPPRLSVTLKGLHSMHDASKATILYSPPVDGHGVLQKFCEKIRAAFQEAGLILDENRPLLLHATILNTVYVRGGRQHGNKRERLTIDARGMLDRYDDHVWMENVPVQKIAICRMGAKKLHTGDEAYEVEAEVNLNGPG